MSIKEIVNKYSKFLKEDNYDEVFKTCKKEDRVELLNFLYNVCGIDALSHMSSIPTRLFENTNITNISIPSTIGTVGAEAFLNSDVSVVYIDDSVSSIGTGAFMNCKRLNKVRLSRTLEKIDSDTFSGCYNLEKIYIPESVKIIGRNAFNGCDNILIIADARTGSNQLKFSGSEIDFYKEHLKYKRT